MNNNDMRLNIKILADKIIHSMGAEVEDGYIDEMIALCCEHKQSPVDSEKVLIDGLRKLMFEQSEELWSINDVEAKQFIALCRAHYQQEWISDLILACEDLQELNPNNYTHDDVWELCADVEVILRCLPLPFNKKEKE